jgi:preprotein translocase subunit SecA
MEHLKSSVSLQAYGQKDPVIEYKKEARKHFNNIFEDINLKLKKTITSLDAKFIFDSMPVKSRIQKQAEIAIANSGKSVDGDKKGETKTKSREESMGRNEVCHCGSGKKFKKCHGVK